jgi:hypothetical protein
VALTRDGGGRMRFHLSLYALPCFALVDSDASRGGLSVEEAFEQLVAADNNCAASLMLRRHMAESCMRTSLPPSPLSGTVSACEKERSPAPAGDLYWMVCAGLGVFQDVTMRIIAERIVLPDACGTTYVDRELVNQHLKALPPPSAANAYHVYYSEVNPGAVELLIELANERSIKLMFSQGQAPTTSRSSRHPSVTDASRQWLPKMRGKR